MNVLHPHRSPLDGPSSRAVLPAYRSAAASAGVVNRTHRIVRERARAIEARRRVTRSLWIPLGICGGLLAVIVSAVWSVLDQYETAPTGAPDASQQMFVLMMWCLPVSILLLAVVWFRRAGERAGVEHVGSERLP